MNRKEIAAHLLGVEPESLWVFRDMAEHGVVAIKDTGQKYKFTNEELGQAAERIQAESRAAKAEEAERKAAEAKPKRQAPAKRATKSAAKPAQRRRRTTTKTTKK